MAAAPGHGKHGKWISEAVGRYMTLSLKNFDYRTITLSLSVTDWTSNDNRYRIMSDTR